MKRMNKSVYRYVGLLLFFSLAVALVAQSAFAQQGVTRTDVLMLEGKTDQTVISGERHYAVYSDTLIRNEEGEAISLARLLIPCKAEVTYELRQDEQPRALQIRVQETFIRSSPNWSAEEEEEGGW